MKVPKPQRLQLQHHPRCPTVGLLRALRDSEAVYIGAVRSDVLEQPDVVRDQTCLVCGPNGQLRGLDGYRVKPDSLRRRKEPSAEFFAIYLIHVVLAQIQPPLGLPTTIARYGDSSGYFL